MFLAEGSDGVDAVFQREEAIRGEERQHHVGGPTVRREIMADGRKVGGLEGELGEEVELRDGRRDEVDRVKAIAEAVDAEWVRGGSAGEIERGRHFI